MVHPGGQAALHCVHLIVPGIGFVTGVENLSGCELQVNRNPDFLWDHPFEQAPFIHHLLEELDELLEDGDGEGPVGGCAVAIGSTTEQWVSGVTEGLPVHSFGRDKGVVENPGEGSFNSLSDTSSEVP